MKWPTIVINFVQDDETFEKPEQRDVPPPGWIPSNNLHIASLERLPTLVMSWRTLAFSLKVTNAKESS